MAANRTVRDYSNIRIGSATPDGEVYDHSGVRIGTAGPDGVDARGAQRRSASYRG